MSLTEYRRKRDFRKTPEPSAKPGKSREGELRFVIQKHAARRLHYDLRLEYDGVLKSWAVPKGPSLDPARKQLAIQVEDHPLDYGGFEGTIPHGEYGGGTVLVWDRGIWTPIGDVADGFRIGKLKFALEGVKLSGLWALVRMSGKRNESGKNWLLIKERDNSAQLQDDYDIVKDMPLSVLSGRDLSQVAKGAKPRLSGKKRATAKNRGSSAASEQYDQMARLLAKLPGSNRGDQPKTLKVQLAVLGDQIPDGDEWLHEMKFDGYRVLAFVEQGQVRLLTRQGQNWTKKFPTVTSAIKKMQLPQAILDGEVVVLKEQGIPDFQRLQNALSSGVEEEFIYYVFDLPHCLGHDLTNTRLVDRKSALERLLFAEKNGVVRYSEHVVGRGEDVVDHACRHQWEGILSKHVDSPYRGGRSSSWLKTKCLRRQEFVIGGFTRPGGSRIGFGSLLVGYYDEGALRYAGRVGAGLTDASLHELLPLLRANRSEKSPFTAVPRDVLPSVQSWTAPRLVVEVEFAEWTRDKRLRHPSFKGLRNDKPAAEISREESMPATKPVAARNRSKDSAQRNELRIGGISISNADRVVFPQQGLTKGELAKFYEEIHDWILPHIVERPLSLVRCPRGRQHACFYQKHFDASFPAVLHKVTIEEKSKTDEYAFIKDLQGLMTLIQFGTLEIHPWGARVDDLERPDRLIFDLDPGEGASWSQVVQGAKDVRQRLADLGLKSFLRTSGGKGLHVVVPLIRRRTWDEIQRFSQAVANSMANDDPSQYVSSMSKKQRHGRIFVDYLRNSRGATAVSSYSTRARIGAPVATPLRWEELGESLQPDQFTVKNLGQRLSSRKADPWEGFFELRQSVTKSMMRSLNS